MNSYSATCRSAPTSSVGARRRIDSKTSATTWRQQAKSRSVAQKVASRWKHAALSARRDTIAEAPLGATWEASNDAQLSSRLSSVGRHLQTIVFAARGTILFQGAVKCALSHITSPMLPKNFVDSAQRMRQAWRALGRCRVAFVDLALLMSDQTQTRSVALRATVETVCP